MKVSKIRGWYLVALASSLSLVLATLVHQAPYVARIVPLRSWHFSSHKSWKTEGKDELLQTVSYRGWDVRLAIINSYPAHDEVFNALIYTFGSIPGVRLELFLETLRFGSQDIIDDFQLNLDMANNSQPQMFMAGNATAPDIIVSSTCEVDSRTMHQQFDKLLERNQTYLFCVVHHADHWLLNDNIANSSLIKTWINSGKMAFVTLSNHTSQFLENQVIPTWALSSQIVPKLRVFPPIFPTWPKVQEETLSFALQGNYEPSRRDYNGIFEHLSMFLRDSDTNVTLRLVGSGVRPEVPAQLQQHVVFDQALNYPEFYDTLALCFAMLPGFASDTYYDRKASSTIPASVIAGVPVVGPQRLLETYTYLDRDDIWLQNEGETDIDVIGRVLKLDPEIREAKKQRVVAASRRLMQANKVSARQWILDALGTLGHDAS
ncbi:hypothetical protein ANO11243_063500 [Dothideomycetidae sp. 11243]|nr:hypothetical protein ANO11243_063500 [fungal sp. No.11243]